VAELEPLTVDEALDRFPDQAEQISKLASVMRTLVPGSVSLYDSGGKLVVSMSPGVVNTVKVAMATH
jgi:hypothetical protein